MSRGIIIFGAPGSGTTTLGRAVAKELGFQHFDLDDYLWLKDTELPFTKTRPRQELVEMLMKDISKFPHFVMSGSMDSYNGPFVPLFDLAVLNWAPLETRLKRIDERELNRFGERILSGGDMHENHQRFQELVSRYDSDGSPSRSFHERWAATLPCTLIYTDGTLSIEENTEEIIKVYFSKIQ